MGSIVPFRQRFGLRHDGCLADIGPSQLVSAVKLVCRCKWCWQAVRPSCVTAAAGFGVAGPYFCTDHGDFSTGAVGQSKELQLLSSVRST